jgi:hypothetical protein
LKTGFACSLTTFSCPVGQLVLAAPTLIGKLRDDAPPLSENLQDVLRLAQRDVGAFRAPGVRLEPLRREDLLACRECAFRGLSERRSCGLAWKRSASASTMFFVGTGS